MTDVFISYSRKDIAFARLLQQAINDNNLETWIDWQDIPPSTDWLAEVYEAIEQADAFVFVISETSLKSDICDLEIIHAAKHNKRLIPIAINDVDAGHVPKELAVLNWIFFEEAGDKFSEAMEDLVTAITIDQIWVKAHTRFENRALAWERKENDRGLLLRGSDLTDAENWLAGSDGKDPQPTALQTQFILKSREDSTRRQRFTLAGVCIGLMIAIVFGILAWTQRNLAVDAENARGTAQYEAIAEAEIRGTAQAEAIVERNIAENAQNVAKEQAKISQVRELSALSINNSENKIDLAVLLSIEAFNSLELSQSESSLLNSIQKTANIKRIYYGHREGIMSISISPNGDILASGSRDGTIILWDLETGNPIGEPMFGNDSSVWVMDLDFSPNGKLLASGYSSGSMIIWDIEHGFMITEQYMLHTDAVREITFNPDGSILTSGGDDGNIFFWDVISDNPIGNPIQTSSQIKSISYSSDGKLLASGDSEGNISIWDTQKRQLIITSSSDGSDGGINCVSFSPDGKLVASGGYDEVIIIWDVEKLKPLKTISSKGHGTIYSLAFSPDGELLASGNKDGTVIRWDIDTMKQVGDVFSGYTSSVMSVVFNNNGNILISSSLDGSIIEWKNNANQESFGDFLLNHDSTVMSVIYSPDGKTIASGGGDNVVYIWDANTHNLVRKIGTNVYRRWGIYSVLFSPDGETLLSGGDDQTVELWDLKTFSIIGSVQTGHDWINQMVFSKDGEYFITIGGEDPIVRFWSSDGLKLIYENDFGHTNLIQSVAISPDGTLLATAGEDQLIIIWDIENNALYGNVIINDLPVRSIEFSPDSKLLVSGDKNGNIKYWSVESQEQIGSTFSGHSDWILDISFSPDGERLATGGVNNYIYLWDISGSYLISRLEGHSDTIRSITFSPDNTSIVSGGYDGNLILWDIDLHSWKEKLCHKIQRNLTNQEWDIYFPQETYRYTCELGLESNSFGDYSANEYNKIGWANYRSENYTKAIESFTKQIELFPNDCNGYDDRGFVYYQLDEYEKAIADLEKAIEIDPEEYEYDWNYDRLAYANYYLGNEEKSEEYLLKILELFEFSEKGYNWLGWAYLDFQKFDLAIENFTKQIELSPQEGEGYDARGYVYYEIEEYEKTILDLEKAIEIDPEEYGDDWNYNKLAYANFYLGNEEKSEEYLLKILELFEFSKSGYNWLGWSYLDFEKFDQAISSFNKAIELDKDYATPFNGLGDIFYLRSQYDKALENYLQYINLEENPDQYIVDRVEELSK